MKPFTKAESHFADTRFFELDDAPKEAMPSAITSTVKGGTKNVLQALKEDMPNIRSRRKKANREEHRLL